MKDLERLIYSFEVSVIEECVLHRSIFSFNGIGKVRFTSSKFWVNFCKESRMDYLQYAYWAMVRIRIEVNLFLIIIFYPNTSGCVSVISVGIDLLIDCLSLGLYYTGGHIRRESLLPRGNGN